MFFMVWVLVKFFWFVLFSIQYFFSLQQTVSICSKGDGCHLEKLKNCRNESTPVGETCIVQKILKQETLTKIIQRRKCYLQKLLLSSLIIQEVCFLACSLLFLFSSPALKKERNNFINTPFEIPFHLFSSSTDNIQTDCIYCIYITFF